MSRNSRNCINTTFFHIMVQGLNKEYIFSKNEYKNQYLKLINIIKLKFNISIISYCIMDNHVHILLKIDTVEQMSKFMHKLNTLYARYYNKNNSRVGYVFRDRYKSQQIYSEVQLRACINYIHNNPVKARICKFPYEYKYSSYNEYMQNIEIFEKNIERISNGDEILQNNKNQETKMNFLEDKNEKEEEIQNVITEYLKLNKISLEVLSNDKEKLKKIIIFLKDNYDVSLRKIAKFLNLGREVVRKIVK